MTSAIRARANLFVKSANLVGRKENGRIIAITVSDDDGMLN